MGKKIRIFVGVCLVLVGICYFLYPNVREWRTQHEVNTIIEDFEDKRNKAIADAETNVQSSPDVTTSGSSVVRSSGSEQVSSDKQQQKAQEEDLKRTVMPDLYNALAEYNQNLISSGQQILDAWSYEQSPVDVELLNNGSSVIGYIKIPDMKVKLPLYLGASSKNLEQGAAVLSQTSMPIGGVSTNCVIAGHRGFQGSAFFQYIDRVRVGSMVYITNPWETLTYKVVSTEIVSPSRTDKVMIQDGKDMVTLVSCHPYVVGGGPERYLVFCERVMPKQSSEKSDVKSSDTPSENAESSNAENSEFLNSTSEQEDSSSGNELQKWESLLRILAPMTVVLIGCILVFIQYNKNMKK